MGGAYFVYYNGKELKAVKTDTATKMLKSFEQVESEINLATGGVNGIDWAGGFSPQVSMPIHAVREVVRMFCVNERICIQNSKEIPDIFKLSAGLKYEDENGTLEYLGNGECKLSLRTGSNILAGPSLETFNI
jgi:hypothetical protein